MIKHLPPTLLMGHKTSEAQRVFVLIYNNTINSILTSSGEQVSMINRSFSYVENRKPVHMNI